MADHYYEEYFEDIFRMMELSKSLKVWLVDYEGMLFIHPFKAFKATSTEEEYAEICNGAGPNNFGFLVPDSMYLLNMTIVFDHHDFCYDYFDSLLGKELSDLLMKINSVKFIHRNTTNCPFLRGMLIRRRTFRAMIYYEAVHIGGKWFFETDKEKKK